jgi:hypothetical protein
MIDGDGLPKSLIIERDDLISDTLSQGFFDEFDLLVPIFAIFWPFFAIFGQCK